jgi:hypothetical protein
MQLLEYPKKKISMRQNELILTASVSENVSSQHDDENAVLLSNITLRWFTLSVRTINKSRKK